MTEPDVKDHVERDVKTQCAYCGATFALGENVIERGIHGRTWRFCSDACLRDFEDALQYRDPEALEEEGEPVVSVGEEE